MRIRTALIGFALAGLAVVGTATGASAHSFHHTSSFAGMSMGTAGHGMVTWDNSKSGSREDCFSTGE
ncbi:hypothetical protein [Kitasatospora sp. LaBMicrA B282]|uniref:hypothetical protein n=1 Tax=Kitasatospora sp. LaBMicrA B282 TaxID=3420949 RepID=UPI003D13B610